MFSPSPTHCGVRIGASDDLPMRRNRPFRGEDLSVVPRPCHVLSLESNEEFLLARTVGVDDRTGELVVRAAWQRAVYAP